MSDQPKSPFAGGGGEGGDKPIQQRFSHQPVGARVPERVGRGVYCTGQVILDSPKEFVVDFLQGLTRPYQVVARVVMTPQTMGEFQAALKENLEGYTRTFGPPTPLPPPNPQNRPTIQEIYDNFKLPEEMLSGSYANTVMIGHSVTDFFFDFITGFFPTSSVSARVFMPAPQVPRFLNTVTAAIQQFQVRHAGGARGAQPQPPPPPQQHQQDPPKPPGEGA